MLIVFGNTNDGDGTFLWNMVRFVSEMCGSVIRAEKMRFINYLCAFVKCLTRGNVAELMGLFPSLLTPDQRLELQTQCRGSQWSCCTSVTDNVCRPLLTL